MTLFLFTASYPFDSGGEKNFLHEEIQHLDKKFNRIILVPRSLKGIKDEIPINIMVEESYSKYLDQFNKSLLLIKILTAPLLYEEILRHPIQLLYPKAIFRLLAFLAGAFITQDWVKKWIIENKLEDKKILFYTYWFDHAALGVGLLKKEYKLIKLISRAHGYDLYEEYYYNPPYWPQRVKALSLLDRLFIASRAGLEYIKNRYPSFSSKYEIGLLGTADSKVNSEPSTDGTFRIVSCSMLEKVKRIDLILEGIAFAASLRPEQKFEWHHIGNGIRRDELQKKADHTFPSNAKGYFPGYQDKNTLMKFYREYRIDVFINASETEGTPVSIMEAINCGIPIIATSVGGNVEIVSERNGILLNANPTPEEIAQAILKMIDNPERAQKMRIESRKVWQESYNAEINFQKFAEKLKEIAEG